MPTIERKQKVKVCKIIDNDDSTNINKDITC